MADFGIYWKYRLETRVGKFRQISSLFGQILALFGQISSFSVKFRQKNAKNRRKNVKFQKKLRGKRAGSRKRRKTLGISPQKRVRSASGKK